MAFARNLTLSALTGIPPVQPGEDLVGHILHALEGERLADGDALVLAQKIVSKVENRYVDLRTVEPSPRARELAHQVDKDPRLVEVILSESSAVVRAQAGVLIVAHRLGLVLANAGIDHSNVEQDGKSERVLLWPQDPDASAARIRQEILTRTGVSVAVVINDSVGRPFRNGAVGVAIGAAGINSLLDLRGTPDLFGRRLEVTEVAHADELASAASILMGQAAEGLPVVLARGFLAIDSARPASVLTREPSRDLFR